MSVEQLKACGERESKSETVEVEENNIDGSYISKYTGEWHQDKELGKQVC